MFCRASVITNEKRLANTTTKKSKGANTQKEIKQKDITNTMECHTKKMMNAFDKIRTLKVFGDSDEMAESIFKSNRTPKQIKDTHTSMSCRASVIGMRNRMHSATNQKDNMHVMHIICQFVWLLIVSPLQIF